MQYQGQEIDAIRILVRQFQENIPEPLLHGEEGDLVIRFRVKNTHYGENDRTGELVCTHELKVLGVHIEDPEREV